MTLRSTSALPVLDVASGAVTAGTLAERVIAARSAKGMTAARLQRATKLSARTIRDIESGNAQRRYSPTTLAQLDGALGWEPGTAWGVYQSDQGAATTVDAELAEIRRRLVMLEEAPPWASELVDLVRLLSAEDRYRILDLARRLGAFQDSIPRR